MLCQGRLITLNNLYSAELGQKTRFPSDLEKCLNTACVAQVIPVEEVKMMFMTEAMYDVAAVDLAGHNSAYDGRLVIQGYDRAGNDFDSGRYMVDFDLSERTDGEFDLLVHGIAQVKKDFAHPSSPAYGGAWLKYADHDDVHVSEDTQETVIDIRSDRTYTIHLIDEPSGTTQDYLLTKEAGELIIEPVLGDL